MIPFPAAGSQIISGISKKVFKTNAAIEGVG